MIQLRYLLAIVSPDSDGDCVVSDPVAIPVLEVGKSGEVYVPFSEALTYLVRTKADFPWSPASWETVLMNLAFSLMSALASSRST